MRRGSEALVGGATYTVASIMAGILLALPDEAWFEALYPPRPPEVQPSLLLCLGHKALYGVVMGVLYQWAMPSLRGAGWVRGATFGLTTSLLAIATYIGEWPIFGGAAALWVWWGAYAVLLGGLAGAAMGWATQRFLR